MNVQVRGGDHVMLHKDHNDVFEMQLTVSSTVDLGVQLAGGILIRSIDES